MSKSGQFDIDWIDRGTEPKGKSDPRFPLGMTIDTTSGHTPACTVELPWPAKRCGMYLVKCETCGTNMIVTTGGRLDDPRTIKLVCKPRPEKTQ